MFFLIKKNKDRIYLIVLCHIITRQKLVPVVIFYSIMHNNSKGLFLSKFEPQEEYLKWKIV